MKTKNFYYGWVIVFNESILWNFGRLTTRYNHKSTLYDFSEENIVGAFEIKENIIVNIYIKFSFLKMNRIMELVN